MAREGSQNPEESRAVDRQRRRRLPQPESWPTAGPFSMMRRFTDEMDRMFERFGFPNLDRTDPGLALQQFAPQVDIADRDGKLIISADLPGMTKDDVSVDITEHSLVIEGERRYEHQENQNGVYRSERNYGHFRREIPLPEGVSSENATATFKNGVLQVSLDAPRTSQNRRRIEIEGDATDGKASQSSA